MSDFGRVIMFTGLILLVAGSVLWGLGRIGFRGLPGDFSYESEHIRFYFPVATCLVLSLLLTLLFWGWQWLSRR